MARSREGDQQAFEALVLRYQKMIFALTYRMTGSAADAEDLTQESFIAAFQQLDSFRGESKFSSWLYRIATNRCLNWRQRDARRERAYGYVTSEEAVRECLHLEDCVVKTSETRIDTDSISDNP